jgi:hypothetical protein
MKNIQENIYRVKSLMNLLVEDDVTPNTQIPKLDPESLSDDEPVFLKDESLNILEDNKYYLFVVNGIFTDGLQRITYYKDEILTVTIEFHVRNNMPTTKQPWSEIFNILNTATIENENLFQGDAESTFDILLKDYKKNITLFHLYVDKNKKIESIIIHVKNKNNEKFKFSISGNYVFVDDFENNLDSKVENGKIILTSTDGKVLDFESDKQTTEPTTTPTEPTTTPTEPKPTEEPKKTETPSYPSGNNFLSIADDIYQDLIKGIIPNVKIVSSDKITYNSDKTKLDSIEFVLQIGGVNFKAIFSKDGLYLEKVSPKKQVRAIWNGKELKYRNIKSTELGDKNKLLRLQPDLSLSEQVRILKKYIDKLYLI